MTRKATLPRTRGPAACLIAACLLASTSPAPGGDWPQWRGPERDGRAPGFQAPAAWPDSLRREWRAEVGEGHAGPVVVGDRVYVHARLDDLETLSCLSLSSGEVLWRRTNPAPYEMHPAARGHGKGPKSTPAAAGGRVFTLGITGILSCRDAASGELLWRWDSEGRFPAAAPVFGTATSPLVVGDLVIAHLGGPGQRGPAGAVGRQRRRALALGGRRSGIRLPFGGGRRWSGAGDPVGAVLSGPRRGHRAGAVAPPLHHPVRPEHRHARPSRAGDRGSLRPGAGHCWPSAWSAAKPDFEVRELWHNQQDWLYMASPVVAGGRLFGLTRKYRGRLFCLDARTGEKLWEGPGELGDNAVLVDLGPALLVLTTEARLAVVSTSAPEFSLLAEYRVAESPTWAHPALAGERILVKDKTHLACWRLPAEAAETAP